MRSLSNKPKEKVELSNREQLDSFLLMLLAKYLKRPIAVYTEEPDRNVINDFEMFPPPSENPVLVPPILLFRSGLHFDAARKVETIRSELPS